MSASKVDAWTTSTVGVAPTPAEGETGFSIVHDRPLVEEGAVTNGRIAVTPPEAESPGIKVQPESYSDSGPPPRLALSGCLMT